MHLLLTVHLSHFNGHIARHVSASLNEKLTFPEVMLLVVALVQVIFQLAHLTEMLELANAVLLQFKSGLRVKLTQFLQFLFADRHELNVLLSL